MNDVASMTGFADFTQATDFGSIGVEVKSVNGRFLELSLRLPDDLRHAEPLLRERIGAAVSRGKLDCRVNLHRDPVAAAPRINPAVLAQLAGLAEEVGRALPHAAPPAVGDVLRWPGLIDTASIDPEAWQAPLLTALDGALDGLRQARVREGAALRQAVLERCQGIEQIVGRLREAMPRILADVERRLGERIGQALASALAGGAVGREEINERIRQEITLQGARADVAEEMDRLTAHVAEVRRTLAQGGPVGRRLDFLMQELNRESNTIASKAAAIDMTAAAVELKLLIEQMREQIQNLE